MLAPTLTNSLVEVSAPPTASRCTSCTRDCERFRPVSNQKH